jgi:hypothetical protein
MAEGLHSIDYGFRGIDCECAQNHRLQVIGPHGHRLAPQLAYKFQASGGDPVNRRPARS